MQVGQESGRDGVRRSRSVRIAAGLGVTALGAVVVAGCASKASVDAKKAGDGAGASANTAISAAALQMVAAKSVHVHATMVSDGATGTIDGGVVFAPKLQGSLTVTQVSGAPTPAPSTSSTPSTSDGGSGAISELPTAFVLDGGTMYEKFPAGLLASTPGMKPWTSFPIGLGSGAPKPGVGAPGTLGLPLGALGTDPQQLVAKLLAAGKFTHGSGTTYSAVFGDTGNPVHVDIVLDASGLPQDLTVDEKKSADGMAQAQNLKLHFSDWGKPVTITVPPADQVQSLEDVMKGAPTDGFSSYPSGFPSDAFPTGPIIIPGAGPTTCVTQTAPTDAGMPSGMPTAMTFCGPLAAISSLAKS